MSNLPIPNLSKRSDKSVQLYFDTYFKKPVNFTEDDINSAIAFFESKGFSTSAAIAVATVLLNQAKLENISVFKILDTLKKYPTLELNAVVAEILNYNRRRTSAVGFKKIKKKKTFESRNIIDDFIEPTILIDPVLNFSSTETTFDSNTIKLDGE